MGLVQTGRVRVFVLVIQLFLQLTLVLGRLPGVFGRGGRVDVHLLIHRYLLQNVCHVSDEGRPIRALRNPDQSSSWNGFAETKR